VIDRSEVNRALAKAIAFKACGNDRYATLWAAELIRLLECADILRPDIDTLQTLGNHAKRQLLG